MKYFHIKISQNIHNEWVILCCKTDNVERVDKQSFPHPQGWFHCPITKTLQQGFDELKQCMVNSHEKEIKRLKNSLKTLKQIKLNKE